MTHNTNTPEVARTLRYKRAALDSLGAEFLWERLEEIQEACDEVQYFTGSDDKTLLDALDGDEEEAFEFKMMFAELSSDADHLRENLLNFNPRDYDDTTVAFVGNRYRLVGFDSYEMDYFHLVNGYQEDLAQEASAERLLRKTKKELLECFRHNWCIFLAFFDLDQRYQHLQATMDLLRGENGEILRAIRIIEAKYEAMFAEWTPTYQHIDQDAERQFDRLLDALPDRAWIE